MVADLIRGGARVGVSATSHKAINNVLAEVEQAADRLGLDYRGMRKTGDPDSAFDGSDRIENTADNEGVRRPVAAARRRHHVAVRARRDGQRVRLPGDRRGRADVAGRRRRRRNLRAQPDPARRPDAAPPCLPGLARGGHRGVGAGTRPGRRTPPSPPTAACSSPRPGACTPTCAGSSAGRSTTGGSTPTPTARGRPPVPGPAFGTCPSRTPATAPRHVRRRDAIAAEIERLVGR